MNTVADLVQQFMVKTDTSLEYRPWKTIGKDTVNPDLDSKAYFKLLFEAKGYQVYIPEDRYSVVDLYITKNYNKAIGLELKSIDCSSNKWSDTRIDRQKVDRLRELTIPAYLLLAWTDKFSLVDVATEFNLVTQYCHKTTAWSSGRVNKEMYSIDNNRLVKLDYISFKKD